MEFTPEQLKNFKAYLRVQANGSFNMFDGRARRMTSMDRAEWIFCMEHYGELKKATKSKQAA